MYKKKHFKREKNWLEKIHCLKDKGNTETNHSAFEGAFTFVSEPKLGHGAFQILIKSKMQSFLRKLDLKILSSIFIH